MTGWWIIVFLFVLFGKPRESSQCSISSISVSNNASDTPLIGDNELYIIACEVSVVCPNMDDMANLTISWNLVGNDSMYNEISDGTFFNNFTIGGPVKITDAQVYNCSAVVDSMTDSVTKFNSTTFSVTIQTPSVDVTNTTVSVGDTAMLNCTVTVAIDISSLVEPTIIWASPGGTFPVGMTSSNGNSFVSRLPVSPVSSDSAGEYTCSASIAPKDKNKYIHVIPSANGTGSGNLYAIEYSFNASETVRLDVAPYNDFILQCSVTYFPTDSSPTINFTFTDNNMMDSSMQTDNAVSNNPRRSQLAVDITAASGETEFTYSCNASVSFVGSETLTEQNSTSITVRGPAPPLPALLLAPIESPTSVTVGWKVPRVSYTPEDFTVYYGLESGSLNYSMSAGRSRNITEEGFLTDTDQQYSVTIKNLASATQYFYQILSNNTFNTSRSVIGNFTTGDAVPSEPTDVRLDVVSATELTLRWGPPDLPNGDITHYNYSCAGVNDTEPMFNDSNSVFSSPFSVPFSGLSPFIEYQCNVTASTSAGAGSPGTDTAVTAQAAPTGEPLNFEVTSNNVVPRQLNLSWNQPQRDLRNGIITNYLYNCAEVDDPSIVFSDSTSMNTTMITGLKVFTNYTCSVRAATKVGEGPAAVFMDARTGEDEPSIPSSLVSIGLNSSTFNVILGRPDRPNGVVTHYVITVVLYSNGSVRAQENSLTESITIRSSNFVTGVPYNISAYAVTGGGGGPPITITNFTQQGTPRSIIPRVNRINGTTMIVTWEPLSIIDAMGFVSGYTVTATPTNSRKRQAEPIVVPVDSSVTSVTIRSLDGDTIYIVTVIASNGETDGPTSQPVTVSTIATEKPKDDNIGVIVGVTFLGVFILIILIVIIVILMVYLMRANTTKNVEIHSNPLVLEKNGGEENGGELKLLSIRTDQVDNNERMTPINMSDFAEHVRQLHQNRDLGFEEEYESLKSIPPGSFTQAKLQDNIPRNRFDNVYSYDDSRVVLSTTDGGSDYINASFLNGYNHPKAYVAAQGPLANTVGDFWRMMWEFQLPTVVMLTELVERGIEKCTCYYPRNINDTLDVGHGLKITLIEQQQFVEYKFKKFLLLNTSQSNGGRLDVTHYHFLAWPDHGVPADKTVMIAFAKRVRQTHPPEGPPLVVHCSAGVGRTGTFIVLDTMIQRIEKKEDALNIYELVADMRHRRTLMVQTAAQYIYTHDALSEYIICGDTSITTKSLKVRMNDLEKVSGGESGYQKQMKLLNQISRSPSEGHCSDALSKQNVDKNRYSQNISSLPYNETRVHLKTTSGSGDYINASIVDGYKHRGAFLATQAPLQSTIDDFWRMVWDQWSAAIVMLCAPEEEESMCRYWPEKVDEKLVSGMLEVKLISEKEEKDFVVRKLEVSQESNYINLATGSADKLQITQYQYLKWSSNSKPSNPAPLLELLNQLLRTQKLSGNKAITVMCNDGIDRTGAFICIYSQLERVKVEGIADVFQFVKASRFNRPGLVQRVENYVFCHELLLEFLNTFDQYENFK